MASVCSRLSILACSRARLLLVTTPSRFTRNTASIRGVATTQWKGQVQRRYGKGTEPASWEKQKQEREATEEMDDGGDEGMMHTLATTATEQDAMPPTDQEIRVEDSAASGREEPAEKSEVEERIQEDDTQSGSMQSAAQDSSSSANPEEVAAQAQQESQRQTGPLEAVLHMAPPRQHPHMAPPPYVHHFDTYSLVKQLDEGGYTQEQAIEVMKGVRAILAQNLDVAQESLVSKSDVENETYLFRAACSELSTEIKNNRRLQDEQMRQQRTHLQHEVDILTQSLNQELLTLNDTVRGMFNDRKMAVREEQKAVESAVQQISYKISIMLSSDAKSEIEGVRWILIRRSVLGILFMAVLTLGTLRYATYVGQERKREAERKRKEEEEEQRRELVRRQEESPADAAVILAAN